MKYQGLRELQRGRPGKLPIGTNLRKGAGRTGRSWQRGRRKGLPGRRGGAHRGAVLV